MYARVLMKNDRNVSNRDCSARSALIGLAVPAAVITQRKLED